MRNNLTIWLKICLNIQNLILYDTLLKTKHIYYYLFIYNGETRRYERNFEKIQTKKTHPPYGLGQNF